MASVFSYESDRPSGVSPTVLGRCNTPPTKTEILRFTGYWVGTEKSIVKNRYKKRFMENVGRGGEVLDGVVESRPETEHERD